MSIKKALIIPQEDSCVSYMKTPKSRLNQIRFLHSPPYGTVAQQAEHLIEAQGSVGSSPTWSTNKNEDSSTAVLIFTL